MTFSYRIQESKYIKCNGPHKSEHHCYFAWCCKANFKINLLRLEMKQGKLCSYLFKCLNCKGNHQANFNMCPFWKHRFNKEWYMKKYQEIHNNRKNLIYSVVSEQCSSIILKDIKKFSQNVHKNNFIINTILKIQNSFDIIFIQESSWSFICSISSSKYGKGEELVGIPNHPN